jgi:hypothetical protein
MNNNPTRLSRVVLCNLRSRQRHFCWSQNAAEVLVKVVQSGKEAARKSDYGVQNLLRNILEVENHEGGTV